MKEASLVIVDAVRYQGKDVVAYVGKYEQGMAVLAVGQGREGPIYYGCIDPLHRCSEAWLKMRKVDLSVQHGGVRLIAAWDIDDVVICLEDGSACFWGSRSGDVKGGPLAKILPELRQRAPHISTKLVEAREKVLRSIVVGISADGFEVIGDGEKEYYAVVSEKRDEVLVGWWIVYGRVAEDGAEACVIYDGSGAGRIFFGKCRKGDEIELAASRIAFEGVGSRRKVKVRAVVEGNDVAVAVFGDKAIAGGRVVKVKEVLSLLSPKTALVFSKLLQEGGNTIMYG